MPLIRYFQYITYPDGTPAGNVVLPVWLLGGNQPVALFADKAATLPLANPVTTAADGLVDVYAAPGPLTMELAGQVFPLLVHPSEPDEAWPNLFVHDQAVGTAVWNVAHFLGVEPSVTVLAGGQVVEGDVTHPDSNTTVITFGSPVAGTAFLRR